MANILILDDDHDVRKNLATIIDSKTKHQAVFASCGEEGIEILKVIPIDLVVTDIMMPFMNGIDFISKVKKDFPDLKVIAITGGGNIYGKVGELLEQAKKQGADGLVEKPYKMKDILKLIEDILLTCKSLNNATT